jgi:hypothetical protein
MKVARQFIAWYPCENGNRPVGHGRLGPIGVLRPGRLITPGQGSDRALRDGFSIGRVPGNKLPGYDHWSLRDNKLAVLSTFSTPDHTRSDGAAGVLEYCAKSELHPA